MNYLKRMTLLSATALLALVSCVRESTVPDNPTYDPNKGEVTTQFVMSVSTNRAATKMTADVVQDNGQTFRGMRAVHLLTYELTSANKKGNEFFLFNPDPAVAGTASRDYDMGNMVSAGEISETNSTRVVELSLPLKTNGVLLYALPQKPTLTESGMSETDYNNHYGAITAGLIRNDGSIDTQSQAGFGTDLSKARFELVNRLTDKTSFIAFGQVLADILTSIVIAECKGTREYAYWWPQDATSKTFTTRVNGLESEDVFRGTEIPQHQGYTYVTGETSWRAMGHDYKLNHDDDDSNDVQQNALAEVLGEAYYQLCTIAEKDGGKTELRAGSAASILKTMRDLYAILRRVMNADASNSQEEQVAKEMAKEIDYRLRHFFAHNGDETSINYLTLDKIKTNLSEIYTSQMSTTWNDRVGDITFTSDYLCDNTTLTGGFPVNIGLPMSAALLEVDNSNTTFGPRFYYRETVPAYGMPGVNPVPIDNYRFPPELMYWANSGVRVSDLEHTKQDYPTTVANWATGVSSTGYWKPTKVVDNVSKPDWVDNGSVSSTTRSVAVMKQVNYGVALLESRVSYATESGKIGIDGNKKYIEDNNAEIHPGEAANKIYIDGSSFKVTGILIGGVADRVGWDYTIIADNTENPADKIIYNYVGDHVIPASGTVDFFTLTWDNYLPAHSSQNIYTGGLGTQADQTNVYIAVELQNNTGKDIWGELNLIRNGGTFYLVGKMDLNAAIAANDALAEDKRLKFPVEAEYHYPPFDPASGATVQVKRVFMQDYKTIANLKFTKTSLSNAYVTVPDLRASQISLGLSVDVDWEPGLSFDVNMGEMN